MSTTRHSNSKIDRFITVFLTCALVGMLSFSAFRIIMLPVVERWETEYAKIRMGGDFEVGRWGEPLPADLTAFMLFQGAQISRIAEASTVAKHSPYNANVSIKGIDDNYPLYGKLQLARGDRPFPFFYDHVKNIHGAAIDGRVIKMLHLKVGDQFKVGNATFEVTAIIIDEPDPTAGKMALLPRIIMSTRAFAHTGVIDDTPQKTLFRCRARLPADNTLEMVKKHYSSGFHYPQWWWRNWDKSPEPK